MKQGLVGSVLRRSSAAAGAILVTAAVAGCGGSASSVEDVPAGPALAASQQDWDGVVDGGRAEGAVTVYSSLPGSETTFAEFEKAYPDITVTVERAPTNDLIARLDQELAVNAPGADVAFHAQAAWFDEHSAADDFAAIALSPAAVAEGWKDRLGDRRYAEVYSYPYLIGYNTGTASRVTSVEQLIAEAGDARIGILSPAAATAVAYQYDLWLQAYGPDFLKKLSSLNVRVESSTASLSQALAAGEIDYVVGLIPGGLQALKAEGATIDEVVPDRDPSGPVYGIAPLGNAPHPNAAQLFVNWLAGTEGQSLMIGNHSPGSVPLPVDGSIPWGEIKTYDDAEWPKARWDEWLSSQWNPLFN